MSDRTDTFTLVGEIRKSRSVLRRITEYYESHFTGQARPQRSTESAIVLAEILGNYYTAVETIFLRIAQYFENNLAPHNWHKELLRKMTLEIPAVRERVIGDDTFADLQELLRFRHFRRYYLQFDYDWKKLEFVEEAFLRVRPKLDGELDNYERFLMDLAGRLSE